MGPEGAEQVLGDTRPVRLPAVVRKRGEDGTLVSGPREILGPGAQQYVIEGLVEQPEDPAAARGNRIRPGNWRLTKRGEPGELIEGDAGPVEGLNRQLPQLDRQAGCLGKGQHGQGVVGRDARYRAQALEVGGQG